MLRARCCSRSILRVRFGDSFGYTSCKRNFTKAGLSSVAFQKDNKDSYSIPYTYHMPVELLDSQHVKFHLNERGNGFTAEASSIETEQEVTAFDDYYNLLHEEIGGNVSEASLSSIIPTENLDDLFRRQLELEQELNHFTAVESIKHIIKLTEMGKSANLMGVQKILLEWFEPFVALLNEKIEAMTKIHKLKEKVGKEKNEKKSKKLKEAMKNTKKDLEELIDDQECGLPKYGTIMSLLLPEKLAVITMNTVINYILKSGNNARASSLCMEIADVVETEVNLAKSNGKRLWVKAWQKEQVKDATGNPQIVKSLGRRIRKYYGMLIRLSNLYGVMHLLDLDSWDQEVKLKLGGALVEYLRLSATVNGAPALIHDTPYISRLKKRIGLLMLSEDAFKTITEDSYAVSQPKYLPMLVPPTPWSKRNDLSGGYLITKTPFLRFRTKSQVNVLTRASVEPLLEGLNYLGSTPWKINKEVYDVVKELYEKGEVIGEIPTREMVPMPQESDCFVPRKELREERMKKYKGQKNNQESNQINPDISDISDIDETDDPDDPVETDGQDEMSAFSSLDYVYDDEDLEESDTDTQAGTDESNGDDELVFDKSVMKYLTKKVKQRNQNIHSLRCDAEIKFSIADRFKDDTFYFPWNVDFRGRAYPVPPNLNHMGSDLCRGILMFAEAKPLGPRGLDWLKCHLCNLFGYNKTDYNSRVQWSNDNLENIFDSATNPIHGKRFWATSEDPFQSLATCIEIYKAIKSGDPENYQCSLPVHQDGSCNGLQHYAALGRDKAGGQAVNLTPSSRPQDVYSEVLTLVLQQIEKDCKISEDEPDDALRMKGVNARLVTGHVDRKVIKQTVMTSVYGVTFIGAKTQIMGKLKDNLYGDEMISKQLDEELFSAARCDIESNVCFDMIT